eukprot:scaffold22.g6095.t1
MLPRAPRHDPRSHSRARNQEMRRAVLRRGPEPLRSQFSTGYGMVLNLLATYLGSIGAQRRQAEAAALEAKAEALLAEVARQAGGGGSGGTIEQLLARYEKLQGRLREEKRAAKLLRAQVVEERAAAAAAALAAAGLPAVVGLDLSASNVDDSSYRLPALAVAARPVVGDGGGGAGAGRRGPGLPLEDGAGAAPEDWVYLCLGADNCLYEVAARQVAAVLAPPEGGGEGPAPPPPQQQRAAADGGAVRRAWLEAAAGVAEHAAGLPPSAWRELAGGSRATQGSALTAAAASRLPPASQLPGVALPGAGEGGAAALAAQRARVKDVKRHLAELREDRRFVRASKQYARAAAKAGLLMQRAAQLRQEAAAPGDASWRAFEALLGVLVEVGALETGPGTASCCGDGGGGGAGAGAGAPERLQGQREQAQEQGQAQGQRQREQGQRVEFTALGRVARELNGQNELWLALVLTHQAYQALSPSQLAAAASAVVAPEAVSRPGGWVAYPPSEAVIAAVEGLEDARAQLAALQVRAGVDAPLPIDLRLAGLVEAWAAGCEWREVMADCSLDDGDVATHCQHLLPSLRSAARKAVAAMDRKPISELVAG